MNKSYLRDAGETAAKPEVMAEVRKLLQDGHSDYTILQKLKAKYKDEDMVNAVFDAYKDRLKTIMKRAQKFKQAIWTKYAPMQLPFDELLKKAKKYARKYKLADDEFDMFVNLALGDKRMTQYQFHLPTSPMARTLGYEAAMAIGEKLNVKENELDTVQAILRLYGETRTLHAQVLLQSLTYYDCAPEALSGRFDEKKHSPYSYVHPVIAALFLPKFPLLEERMLVANLGGIVKTKNDGNPILTKPDYNLYWALITDPNDHVCSMESPIKDLHNRFVLQTKLWDNVLSLRQGHYYHEKLSDFLVAIEQCRSNIYDAPDLTYVRDEGTILRRLLAAFSIRPTLVSTSRLYNMLGAATYGYNALSAAGITEVTTVPMVTLRLPLSLSGGSSAVSLDEALDQPQWFVENKTIVPKTQHILHSKDLLIFYIGRRYQTVNITRLHAPYNFTSLPMTVAGWEAINERVVNFNDSMEIFHDDYYLRSVICVEKSQRAQNLIVGSSAAIVIEPMQEVGRYDRDYVVYDPQGAAHQFRHGGNFTRQGPISWVPYHTPFNVSNDESFYSRAARRGTVFIYQKMTDNLPHIFRQ